MENSATLNRDTTVRFVHDFDSKTLQGCLARFKEQKALPFGGFPARQGFLTVGTYIHDEEKFPNAVAIK